MWKLCWGTTWQNAVVILISMQETVSLLLGVALLLRRSRTGTTWPRNEHSATAYGTRRLTAIYHLVPLRFRSSLFTSGGNQDGQLDSILLWNSTLLAKETCVIDCYDIILCSHHEINSKDDCSVLTLAVFTFFFCWQTWEGLTGVPRFSKPARFRSILLYWSLRLYSWTALARVPFNTTVHNRKHRALSPGWTSRDESDWSAWTCQASQFVFFSLLYKRSLWALHHLLCQVTM